MSHDLPFRLRTLRAISETLRGITITDGYAHDMDGKVFRGRTLFGDSDPLPMLSILQPPTPDPQDQHSSGIRKGRWDLLIQGFVDDDDENPTDPAELLLADVMVCLGKEIVRRAPGSRAPDPFGMGVNPHGSNVVEKLELGFGVVRPPDEFVSAKAYFWLPISLSVIEDVKNPFA